MDNKSERILQAVLSELNGRGGFDDWYNNLDEEIVEDIEICLKAIIEKELDQ